MKITEFLHHIEIEQSKQETLSSPTCTTRMAIPKSVLTQMLPYLSAEEAKTAQVVDSETRISYLFVPQSDAGLGGLCGNGPCLGPTLVAEAANGDRLLFEMTWLEVQMLEAVVANFEHVA